jgi:PiT family inorganic phosphate transporter
VLVIAIGCYQAFAAGASNAANAVAPLVGNGAIDPSPAILLAVGALAGYLGWRRLMTTAI